MVDAVDSKSTGLRPLRVRFPPSVPLSKPFERRVFIFQLKIHRPSADGLSGSPDRSGRPRYHILNPSKEGFLYFNSKSTVRQPADLRVLPIHRDALGTNTTLYENAGFLFFTNKYFNWVKLRGRGVKYN